MADLVSMRTEEGTALTTPYAATWVAAHAI